MRAAPSIVPARPMPGLAPEELVRRLLRRLGDRRFIRTVELGSPPPVTFLHRRGYYAGGRPPKDALWAYIAAPAATATLPAQPRPQQVVDQMIAQWETSLVQGALRDDFCAAGGRSLVGSTAGRGVIRVSDRVDALEQQFPSPSPAAFRRRVDLVGRRYGFRVDSLRLLRPRQLAPLLVVETDRDRKAFVRDLPAIMKLLDPISSQAPQTAVTFEGFLLAARDRHSPFVSVENVYRGEVEGGQWSWNRCAYPYAHSEPLGAKPCP